MGDLARREPALVAAVVNAVLVALVTFGLHLTEAQIAAVMTVTNAVLALVVRSQVTPTQSRRKPRQ